MREMVKKAIANTKLFLVSKEGKLASKLIVSTVVMVTLATNANAATIDLESAVQKIWDVLRSMSHYAAGVGVACGALIKKFSMGKPDKIDSGNNLIKQSILGWMLINGISIILSFVNTEILNNGSDIDINT